MRSDESHAEEPERGSRGAASLLVEVLVGFAYWLGFLLLLQPGNLIEMGRGGVEVAWSLEAWRIAGAAALGAAITPLLLALSRRFPVEGPRWRRNLAVYAVALPAISGGLIVLAQALADVGLRGRDPRLRAPLEVEVASNGALLLIALAAFVAVAHAVRFLRGAEAQRALVAARAAGPDGQVVVKTRSGAVLTPLGEIDWIESQDNYVALHCGAKVHMIRETLAKFERRLDPHAFVRIHRRTIVRADRVRSLTPLSNGDGLVLLQDGTELRLSRSYRQAAGVLFPAAEGAPAGP